MAKVSVILARPDASCGKVFYRDRRAAEEHRIVLNVWNRATGKNREACQLAVFQCTRCGGFHVGRKRGSKSEPQIDEISKRVLQLAMDQEALGYLAEHDASEDFEMEDECDPLPSDSSTDILAKSPRTDFYLDHHSEMRYFAR